MRKLRVLHVIDRIGNAGAETLLRTLAESLDSTRFELHVCGLRPRPGSVTLPALRELGVPILVLDQHSAYDVKALLGLASYIRRYQIDIVHTHLQAADIMGRMAGCITRRPVVSTIHGGVNDLDDEPLRRRLLERWTARLWCRRLVVVSDSMREGVQRWHALPSSRVITIENGVDTERFRHGDELDREAVKRSLTGGSGPLVTNVARLVPQKGQQHLIEAARRVVAMRPDAHFALVGEGSLLDDLREQTAAAQISSNVWFAGFRDDVPDILAATDVFVLSSVSEGMPVALLEAMAAGCATVATGVGGVTQVLQHGITGLIVPPADPEAMSTAILRCLNDPDFARRLGPTAQDWVSSHYGMCSWAAKLEALYLYEVRHARKRRNVTTNTHAF